MFLLNANIHLAKGLNEFGYQAVMTHSQGCDLLQDEQMYAALRTRLGSSRGTAQPVAGSEAGQPVETPAS